MRSTRFEGLKVHQAVMKTVSRCKFSFKSEARIAELQQIMLKKKTEAKLNWLLIPILNGEMIDCIILTIMLVFIMPMKS